MKKLFPIISKFFFLTILVLVVSGCTSTNPTSSGGSSSENKEAQVEIKSPDPITLTGVGKKATDKFTLTKGLSIFKMTHNGGSNWIVKLIDSNGQDVDLLANEIGAFEGSKAVNISKEGEYVMDVTAGGNWTITIEQPRTADAPSTRDFKGSSSQATEFFKLDKGQKTFTMTNSGTSNFIVYLLNKDGSPVELLANDIGAFDGSKATGISRDGIYVLNVSTGGDWTINIK
jgi:hypothetical protein